MPIIASAVIPIDVQKDRIKILLSEINKCGCLNTETFAKQHNQPIDEVKSIVARLVSENKIACEGSVCCADKKQLDDFVKKLKNIRGN